MNRNTCNCFICGKFVSIKNAEEKHYIEWEISDFDGKYHPSGVLCGREECEEKYEAWREA